MEDVNEYLKRFDEILRQMANKMLSQRVTYNITLDFIHCMVPHHGAAIYMGENLLRFTDYEPLIKIAKGIITMQTKGIEQMEEIARTTPCMYNCKSDVNNYITEYFRITRKMIQKMQNSPRGKNINLNFVEEMIPHHEGAIAMCNNLLKYYIDPRLRDVADQIIKEQSRGVKELEQIREYICSCNK